MNGCGQRAELRRDEGSSTVIGLGTASLAVVLALVVGAGGMGLRAKSQADAAADLAALAAVQALTAGEGEPCEVAEEVAERNGGSVTECIVRADLQRSALEVEVPIELRIPGLERKPVMKGEAVAGIAGP